MMNFRASGAAILFFALLCTGAEATYYNAGDKAARAGKDPLSAPADVENEFASKSFTVTSIQKCYDRVGRKETLEIQRNYIKPYQECQRRLVLLEKKNKTLAAGAKEKVSASDEPRRFYRVRKELKEKPEEGQEKPSRAENLSGKAAR